MKARLCYIDCLKGFAIVLVVIGHVFDGYLNAGIYSEYSAFMCGGYNIIYAFHMALFFVISGYVFRMAYFLPDGQTKPSLKKQILNTVVIYVIYSVLFGIFKIVCSRFTNADTSVTDLIMIPIKPIYPYWYLYILIFYYLLFSSKAAEKILSSGLLAALFVTSVCSNLIPSGIGMYLEIKHFLYYAFFFCLGVMIRAGKLKITALPACGAFAVSVLLMILDTAGLTEYLSERVWSKRLWNVVTALGICLFLFWLFQKLCSDENKFHVKALSFLGRYSLEIYVIHCVFTAGNRAILPKLHIQNFWINILCNIVISTSVPVLFAMFCKKINIHKLLFRPVAFIADRQAERS